MTTEEAASLFRLSKSLLLTAILLLLVTGGCRKKVDHALIENAQRAFYDAEEKYTEGDFEQAAAGFETAVSRGGLNVDVYCVAQTKRAESLARLGRFDEAHVILDDLERGAPDMAPVHIIRCYVFEKQGKPQQAAEQYRLARQYDPQIKKLSP